MSPSRARCPDLEPLFDHRCWRKSPAEAAHSLAPLGGIQARSVHSWSITSLSGGTGGHKETLCHLHSVDLRALSPIYLPDLAGLALDR